MGNLFLATFAMVLLVSNIEGDTISTWSGATGNWSTAANWTPPAVPNNSAGTGYDVTISGVAALDISPTINSLTVSGALYSLPGANPTLTVVHDATLNGSLLFGAEVIEPPGGGPGSLSLSGNLNISAPANPSFTPPALYVSNGSVMVGGNLTNASPFFGMVSATGNDQLQVSGTLTNQSGGTMFLGNDKCFGTTIASCPPTGPPLPGPLPGPTTTVGNLVNNGAIYSWSNITASTLTNSGTTLLIGGSGTFGAVTNSGTIYLSNAEGSIAPEQTTALSVGTGTAQGFGYHQFANGVLNEVLSGSTSYGTILAGPWTIPTPGVLAGYPIDLNGTLEILLQNGFVPTIGESFTMITTAPGDISGTFSNIDWDSFDNGQGYFNVFYNNAAGDVVITAEAVPEPSTVIVVVPALAFVFWRRRLHA